MEEKEYYINLGAYLKSSRERCGVTLEGISEILGVDSVTVWRWENGSRRISLYQFAKYTLALDLYEDVIRFLTEQVVAMLKILFIIEVVILLVAFVILGISIKLLKIELNKERKKQNGSTVSVQNWKIDKQKKWK